MVTFDSPAMAFWDKISSLFVTNCVPCLTTFDVMGTVVACFPTAKMARRHWKIRLADRFQLLRLNRDTPEHSVLDMLRTPTGLDDLWHTEVGSAAYSDHASVAILLRFADIGDEICVHRLLTTPPPRPENIRRSRSFALLLQRLCRQNVVYGEDFGDEDDFYASILIESASSSDPDFEIEFRESGLDFEDLATARHEQVEYADCARIADLLQRITRLVGPDDVREILA